MGKLIDPAKIDFPLTSTVAETGKPNRLTCWLGKWADFLKLHHTLFAMPFALAAMALAARDSRGWPGWRTFLLILAAMVCARTCAMTFNRIVDRKYDAINPRTALRHLPTGQISLGAAWLVWVLTALGFVACAYALNPLCFALSPVALFIICFYSLTKRFTDFTHFFLGLSLSLAPIGAWLAVKGKVELLPIIDGRIRLDQSFLMPLILGIAVVFWLAGFDIIYAIQDYEFDKRHGLRSLVVRWGVQNALRAAFLFHLIMWVTLALFGLLARFRIGYLVGLGIIGASLFIEHWLAQRRSLRWLNIAFFRLNALVSVTFLVSTVAEIVFPWYRAQWH